MSAPAELSAVRLALAAAAARDARAAGADPSLLAAEPIAIIGMACRFPGGADDPEQFWTLLEQGRDAVTRVPGTRWDPALESDDPTAPGMHASPFAGLVDDIVGFDADFFGIAPREAVRMDPQQRVMLEVTWNALRDAGYRSETVRGTETGVFAAIYNDDYARSLYADWDDIDAHTASGTSHGVAAGRISYLLDLHGPALAIDTACSSSLVAVHDACRSLRDGESELALVVASSLLIAPEQSIALSKWGMMAPDGRCKPFDASADGWVRGEGAGALVLKRLADALADGDLVHAVIRGSAVNSDGRSAALTAPNGLAQRAVLRAALTAARLPASRVTYVEAHGTGTAVGDPIELEALIEEFGHGSGAPCLIGSVKANIGHLEAAAGMAGVIKVVQALRHQRVPPHLHFRAINPLVSLDGTRLRIEREGAAWPATGETRLAGVSSFGFGGTNAHVLIEEAPRLPAPAPDEDAPWLLTLSAQDPNALQAMGRDLHAALETMPARDVAWTTTSHDAWRHRVAVTGDSGPALQDALREALASPSSPTDGIRRVTFVFSGHGSHWAGMARESLARGGVFAEVLAECDAIVQPLVGWSLLAVLRDDALASRLDDTDAFQPVLVSLQLAMVAEWAAMGVKPTSVIGHSVGELTAACVAGALTREMALRIAVERGRLMQAMAVEGAMLAVEADRDLIDRVVAEVRDIVVAGENAPRLVTLAGTVESVRRCRALLEQAGATCHAVRVSRAFHSPAMHAAAMTLRSHLGALAPQATRIPLYSTVTGARIAGTDLDARYWERNAREPMRFAAAVTSLLDDGVDAIVEVSPHPVLMLAVAETSAAHDTPVLVVPTWRRGRGERSTWLCGLASLWCAGLSVDRAATFAGPGGRVPLPGYRWQRTAAWAGAPLPLGRPPAPAAIAPMPGRRSDVPALDAVIFESTLRAEDAILRDHRVAGVVVAPGTLLLLAALEAAQQAAEALHIVEHGTRAIGLRDIGLDRALVLPADAPRAVQIVLHAASPERVRVTISSRAADAAGSGTWERHVTGDVVWTPRTTLDPEQKAAVTPASSGRISDALYHELADAGLDLGPSFQCLDGGELFGSDAAEGALRPASADAADGVPILRAAARLDAALHVMAALIAATEDHAALWLPVSYDAVELRAPVSAIARSVVVRRAGTSESAASPTQVADVSLLDAGGERIGVLRGVRVQRIDRMALERLGRTQCDAPVYRMAWNALDATAPDAPTLSGAWLVLEDSADGRTPIADAVDAAGGRSTRCAFGPLPSDADDLFERIEARGMHLPVPETAWDGIIVAWGLDDRDATPLIATGAVLAVLRELAVRNVTPSRGVWLVLRGAADLPGDVPSGSTAAAAIWGLRHTVALEHPALQLRAIDLATLAQPDDAQRVVAECARATLHPRIAIRGREVFVPQLMPRRERMADAPLAVQPSATKALDALQAEPFTRVAPAPGEVEIRVEVAGLNFRDVLGAMGMVTLPGNTLGGECAGTIMAVGAGVTGMSVGDRVMAFALGALRTHVCVLATLVTPLPPWLAFSHAAALPVAYLTAWHALVTVARVTRGERVLVHAAAGGVGLAAVHVARWLGATVVGTAGSPEKRAYLASIGVEAVFDSRVAGFREALTDASGLGTVDVVLNALSDDFIPMSIDVLAPSGRFVEIGKRGIWSDAAVAARRADVRYSVFDLADVAARDGAAVGSALREIAALITQGTLPVLPTVSFPLDACVDAFRYMAQARQIGKIVITMPTGTAALPADGTVVVTGAFGALGRAVTERMVEVGVRAVLLIGRRAPDAAAQAWLESLEQRGVRAQCATVDMRDAAALDAALQMARATLPPLRGVVHAAGVTDDGVLTEQTVARLDGVLGGKLTGAEHLDRLTRTDPLDFFVLFSSASGVLGWPGQTTYAAANAGLDQVASRRRASGRPAVSLAWGAWAGGGMADRAADGTRRFAEAGMRALGQTEALDLLMALRSSADARLLVLSASWPTFAARRDHEQELYRALVSEVKVAGAGSGASPAEGVARGAASLAARVAALPPSLRSGAIRDAVGALAARALGVPASTVLDPTRALRELGLDSLMSVELRNALAAAVGRALPATLLFEHPTVDALSAYTATLLEPAPTPVAPPAAERDAAPPADTRDLDDMSDAEAEAILLEELSAGRASTHRSSRPT